MAEMSRSVLSKKTGVNGETIRYYEKIGIMPDPPRSTKGYRSYDDAHVKRLKFVMRSRDLGFSLEEVRGLLGLVDDRSRTCAEVQIIADQHGNMVTMDSNGIEIKSAKDVVINADGNVEICYYFLEESRLRAHLDSPG